jgi:hypothetical protein
MKPHELAVYHRNGALYVVASLPSSKGLLTLDFVIPVQDGWEGLPSALREAERRSLVEAGLPPAKRHYSDGSTLARAAGSKDFGEFIKGAVMASFTRTPQYVLIGRSIPDLKHKTMEGTPRQEQLPPNTSLDELAEIARTVIEGRDGW